MYVLLNLVTYSAVALLVWWVIEECSGTPATKILARWKRVASVRVRVKEVLLPLVVPSLRLPKMVRIEAAERVSRGSTS